MGEPDNANDFSVELDSDAGEVLTVRLDGELDMAHANWVEDTLAAAGGHHGRVCVDLHGLSFIDSSGIRVLQTLRERAKELGVSVRFIRPSDAVLLALQAADITDILKG